MNMGSSTKQATSTSTSEPPAFQKPYIQKGMNAAEQLYNSSGPSYFPGSTVAGFAPEQEQSFQMGGQHARDAGRFNSDMLSGKYLNSDPYSDQVFNNIQQKVLPSVNSQFMGAGRSGSGLHGDTLTRALTESYSPYASAQYQTGLDRMTAAGANYSPYQALEGIGQQRQGLAQNELQDAMNRFNFNQDKPGNKLAQYMGFVGGNYGDNRTSSTPYEKPSIFSQIAGGGLGLAGLFG